MNLKKKLLSGLLAYATVFSCSFAILPAISANKDATTDINEPDRCGQTRLMWAVRFFKEATVKSLLDQGAALTIPKHAFSDYSNAFGCANVFELACRTTVTYDGPSTDFSQPINLSEQDRHINYAIAQAILDHCVTENIEMPVSTRLLDAWPYGALGDLREDADTTASFAWNATGIKELFLKYRTEHPDLFPERELHPEIKEAYRYLGVHFDTTHKK